MSPPPSSSYSGSQGASLTLAGDVVNYGTLLLDAASGGTAWLDTASYTLTNAWDGTIQASGGTSTGGSCPLSGNLDNLGKIYTDTAFGIGGTGTQNNAGMIFLRDGGGLGIVGDSFTNEPGGLISGVGTLDTSTGTLTNQGTVDLDPPSLIDVSFSPTQIQISFYAPAGMDASTVSKLSNYRLTASGDGQFGDGNDIDLTGHLSSIIDFDPATQLATLYLDGTLPAGPIRLTIAGDRVLDNNGTPLWTGDFDIAVGTVEPTGNQVQAPTQTVLVASAPATVYGDPLTFTATVSALDAGAGTPTGTVQFVVDGSNFGSPVPLAGGQASISTASLPAGSHTVSALYTSDSPSFTGSSGSLAGGQTVNKANASITVTPYDGTYDGSAARRQRHGHRRQRRGPQRPAGPQWHHAHRRRQLQRHLDLHRP